MPTPPHKHGTVHSGPGYSAAAGAAQRRRPRPRRGGAERRRAGRDARRPGRAARRRRGRRGRRRARRRRRQGAARQGRAARRPPVRDRLDRPARHEAELDADAGLRHAADGRLELPVLGVPARGGQGPRRADRSRRPDARDPLPDGGQPRRRQRRDAPRADAAAGAQGGSLLAREDRGRGRGVVEADRAPRAPGRRSDQPAAGLPRALQAPAGRRDPHLGLRLGGELVRARHQAAQGHDGVAVGHARDDGRRASRTRSRRSSRIPTGPCSRSSATARCR